MTHPHWHRRGCSALYLSSNFDWRLRRKRTSISCRSGASSRSWAQERLVCWLVDQWSGASLEWGARRWLELAALFAEKVPLYELCSKCVQLAMNLEMNSNEWLAIGVSAAPQWSWLPRMSLVSFPLTARLRKVWQIRPYSSRAYTNVPQDQFVQTLLRQLSCAISSQSCSPCARSHAP